MTTDSQEVTVPFARPDIGAEEIEAVSAVLRSGRLATGSNVEAFEIEFAEYVGAKHAVAVTSCTAALHLALAAHGVSRGDFVFTSTYTFVATSEAILRLGAYPVLVDIDPITLNLCTKSLRLTVYELTSWLNYGATPKSTGVVRAVARAMTSHSAIGTAKAIVPVHVAGNPCDLEVIEDIAGRFGLCVIEDAAHALPTIYGAGMIGGSRDTDVPRSTCFSFYATKTLTTGEGGMITTDDDHLAAACRILRLHGIDRTGSSMPRSSWDYDIVRLGHKCNMGEIEASMGRVQLKKANLSLARRTSIAKAYTEALSAIEELTLPVVAASAAHSWHLYIIQLQMDRELFVARMTQKGVGTSVHFRPLHLHTYYRRTFGYMRGDYPAATAAADRVVSIPIYSQMEQFEIQHVIGAVLSAHENPR